MKMKCPHCKLSGKTDFFQAGLLLKCPRCQGLFRVPTVDSEYESEAVAEMNYSPESDDSGDEPVDFTAQQGEDLQTIFANETRGADYSGTARPTSRRSVANRPGNQGKMAATTRGGFADQGQTDVSDFSDEAVDRTRKQPGRRASVAEKNRKKDDTLAAHVMPAKNKAEVRAPRPQNQEGDHTHSGDSHFSIGSVFKKAWQKVRKEK